MFVCRGGREIWGWFVVGVWICWGNVFVGVVYVLIMGVGCWGGLLVMRVKCGIGKWVGFVGVLFCLICIVLFGICVRCDGMGFLVGWLIWLFLCICFCDEGSVRDGFLVSGEIMLDW